MGLLGKIFDIFGPGHNKNFYARDYRNAYTFRPDQIPPRQKFQGYVNFVINRALYADTLYAEEMGSSFRLQLGSLVRTATLPEVSFRTETKNQYNRKRIVNTGVEYEPVDIKVFDTVNNEWLTLFMKYFSYHYMDPRNKQYGERDVGEDPTSVANQFTNFETKFGKNSKWDSNQYGYNINEIANFFERIDYVLYHGNKGVQYSLINPVLTRFRTGEIDYSASEVLDFDLTFEYESFTIYDTVNFGLSEFDIARYENAAGYSGPAFVPFNVPIALEENKLEILGGRTRERSGQPQPSTQTRLSEEDQQAQDNPPDLGEQTDPGDVAAAAQTESAPEQTGSTTTETDASGGVQAGNAESGSTSGANNAADSAGAQNNNNQNNNNKLPSVYGNKAIFSTPPEKEKSFISGLLGDIADQALSAAIHGNSIKNAVVNTAVGGIVQGITNAVQPAIRAAKEQPTKEEETATSSTAEKPPVTPPEGGD